MAASTAGAQSKAEIIGYMRENRVSFEDAAKALGLSTMPEAARAAGYEASVLGYVEASSYLPYVFVDCVRSVLGRTAGTAEALGFSTDRVRSLANLRRANDLGFLPACTTEGRQLGEMTIIVEVWTVGQESTVAYHVEVRAGVHVLSRPELGDSRQFVGAYLGYGNRNSVWDGIEASIAGLIRDLAIEFLKATSPN